MQVQQAIALSRWSFSTTVALVATFVAAALAFVLVVTVDQPVTSAAPAVVSLHGVVGADQVAHNRSEGEFGVSVSVGGEQIAHNRSEEGLSNGQ
jgi:hypothetical protein